eukprot:scaffold13680_cov98-Skeletonema_marinoi.AAC.2
MATAFSARMCFGVKGSPSDFDACRQLKSRRLLGNWEEVLYFLLLMPSGMNVMSCFFLLT